MVIYANLILLVGLGVFHIVSLHELTSFRCGFWELYSEYPVQIICYLAYLLVFCFSSGKYSIVEREVSASSLIPHLQRLGLLELFSSN